MDKKRLHHYLIGVAIALGAGSGWSATDYRAAVVVDAANGHVLHAESARWPLPPASLTKLMTVYLLLEAMELGELEPQQRFKVSTLAARQPPSRFGFEAGESVDVATLLAALVVVSGNDAALIAAQGLAGSEEQFVARMNAKARSLGMHDSLFRNASGLPAAGQRTTARDMAVLARTLITRFPDQRSLFALRSVSFNGRQQASINSFLAHYRGATGMKTGFTCRAGFNLVATATRHGRELIGVVLGATTRSQRQHAMGQLLDAALAANSGATLGHLGTLARAPHQGAARPLPSDVRAHSCLYPQAVEREPVRWSIDVGVERDVTKAKRRARRFIRDWRTSLGTGPRAMVIPRFTGVDLYRAVITGVERSHATDTCLAYRQRGGDCIVMDTHVAKAQLEQARRVARLNAAHSKSSSNSH